MSVEFVVGDTVVGGRQTGWTKSMHNLTNDGRNLNMIRDSTDIACVILEGIV